MMSSCGDAGALVGALRASGAMAPVATTTRIGYQISRRHEWPVLARRPLLAQVRPCIVLVVTPEKPLS